MLQRPSASRALAYTLLCLGLVAAGGYLWTAHAQHLGGLLLWALALACPLMHLFGHHGHGAHPARHGDDDRPAS